MPLSLPLVQKVSMAHTHERSDREAGVCMWAVFPLLGGRTCLYWKCIKMNKNS